jgi:hypothetical protein
MTPYRILRFIAISGALASPAVYLLTLSPDLAGIWLLFVIALAAGAFILFLFFAFAGFQPGESESFLYSRFRKAPRWLTIYALVAIAVMITHVTLQQRGEGKGVPTETSDGYELQSHGKKIADITEEDFNYLKTLERRAVSSFLIAGYSVAAIVWFSREPADT